MGNSEAPNRTREQFSPKGIWIQIPLEILEHIMLPLKGQGGIMLKMTSKYFYHVLDNPRMWKIMFMSVYYDSIDGVNYLDDNLNTATELKALTIMKNKMYVPLFIQGLLIDSKLCISWCKSSPDAFIRRHHQITGLKVTHNQLVIIEHDNLYTAPLANLTRVKHGLDSFKQYIGHMNEGRFIGQLYNVEKGYNTLYELSNNNSEPILYKKMIHPISGTPKLKSVNKNLAIFVQYILKDTSTIFNMTTMANMPGYILDRNFHRNAVCSQLNENVILLPLKAALSVIDPIGGRTLDIGGPTQLIEVETCTQSYTHYRRAPKMLSEQMINIDGTMHHIVHCTVNKQHRFYDLTARKMMATINCWIMHVWIPNTCYLAMATRDTVIVIDFNTKKIVSRFRPKDDKNETRKVIKALQASRSSPVLLIGMTSDHYHNTWRPYRLLNQPPKYSPGVVLLYSALTGVRIGHLCETSWNQKFQIELSDDDTKMILWCDFVYVDIYDLGHSLTCAKKSIATLN